MYLYKLKFLCHPNNQIGTDPWSSIPRNRLLFIYTTYLPIFSLMTELKMSSNFFTPSGGNFRDAPHEDNAFMAAAAVNCP